ncbi:MAG: RNA 3'-terminal phosphate cyclase [Candidatus Heimdallarchaeota archaeon LC_3]|nr:MAG: RNA 3'-terminal phosphate cyclase [Candidatus Heimdallarchaeota archaeon LC_3]
MSEIIEIDGTIGGGSVLRLGIPLAIALGKSLRITNVRQVKERRKGLQVQHLTGLNFLTQLTGSQLLGASIGSPEVYLTPGNTTPPPNFLPKIQVPTSAAVSLIIQIVSNYVFASRKPIGFEFEGGGTHVSYSPNFDVLLQVNKPLFEMFGLKMHIQLVKPGFFPQGGAMGRVYMEPVPLSKTILTSGEIESIDVISSASSSLRAQKVAEKQISGFKSVLKPDRTFAGYADSVNPGYACSGIIKYKSKSFKGVAKVGGQNDSPIDIGKETAKMTKDERDNPASVDEQLADQLILPLAFAPSGSQYTFDKMYEHVDTNLKVIKYLMGDILDLQKENGIFFLTKK